MKKVFALLLALSMIFVLFACSKDNGGKKEVLTMATEATFPPYEYVDGDQVVGIDVDVAKAIADKLGMELEVIDMDFNAIIPGVQNGKYDIGMAGMSVTDERKEKVNFTDAYAHAVQVVIVKEGGKVSSVDDLFVEGAGLLVGVQTGTTGELYVTDDLAAAKSGEAKSYNKNTDLIEALNTGKIDCIVLDNEPSKALIASNPNKGLKILDTEYADEEYAIAISKTNTGLYEKVNGALKELQADGTLQSIIDNYIK